jgi:hypothetical protein
METPSLLVVSCRPERALYQKRGGRFFISEPPHSGVARGWFSIWPPGYPRENFVANRRLVAPGSIDAQCPHRNRLAGVRHQQFRRQFQSRRDHNKAVVALANKLARVAWVVVARGERLDVNKAFSS